MFPINLKHFILYHKSYFYLVWLVYFFPEWSCTQLDLDLLNTVANFF